ncbi:MAG: branched-chain amino acid ABC transporter permease [Thermoproteota archaeon]|nr:MAG: branched-chain amino acid ABC transporter permease [Candidatus Korarchaeota archaeon]
MDWLLLSQYFFAGLVIGVIYSLMAVGITFIYSIMKMINWSMGEFYMIGSYVQYALVVWLLGPKMWFLGIPLSMLVVFLLGLVVEKLLITPMFTGGIERKDEYATVITIALMVFFRNLFSYIAGPYEYSPPDYAPPMKIGTLPVSGNRFVAFVGTIIILAAFYLVVRKTWIGRAFRAVAQNRVGAQTAGVEVEKIDMLGFGVGVALAAAAGALLAPVFMVFPENGAISTMKGFEIIVIGGIGSIMGSLVGGLLLGMVESLMSVFISPSYRDVYGFLALMIILAVRPTGFFGEKERLA